MPTLIDRNGRCEDVWVPLPDGEAAPAEVTASSHRLVSLARWQADGAALVIAGLTVGIALAPEDDPADVGEALDRIRLITVAFPAFTDGRGYSTARLLRQRYGWTGELRAVGDIQRDQLFYLSRCGFDTFLLKDGETVDQALTGFRDFSETYQGAVDRGPLFERRGP